MSPFLASLLALGLTGSLSGLDRRALARVALQGPLDGAQLSVAGFGAGAGTTRFVGSLRAGEARTLLVPVDARVSLVGTRVEPAFGGAAAEAARFLGWEDAGPWWGSLDPGLRARARPPIGPAPPRPGGAALALVVGCGILVLGCAKRPLLAGGLGLVGAGLLFLFPVSAGSTGVDARVRHVVEGHVGRPVWLAVEAGWESLELEGPGRLECRPADRALDWTVDLSGPAPRVSARGAALYALRPEPAEGAHYRASANPGPGFAAVWVRAPSGLWESRGAWPRGQALGGVAGVGEAPPGWLAAGLPQGVGVLVGLAEPLPGRSGEERWLRLTGFVP